MVETDQKYLDAGLAGYGSLTKNGLQAFVVLLLAELVLGAVLLNSFVLQNTEIPSWLSIAGLVLQGLLAFAMLMAGFGKLKGEMGDMNFHLRIEYWKLPPVARIIIGSTEFVGAILLIVGFFVQPIAFIGGALILGTMAGAVLTHIVVVKDKDWVTPFVLSIFALVITLIKWNTFF